MTNFSAKSLKPTCFDSIIFSTVANDLTGAAS